MTLIDIGAVAATFSTVSTAAAFVLRSVLKSVIAAEMTNLYKWLEPQFKAAEKRYTDHVERLHVNSRR